MYLLLLKKPFISQNERTCTSPLLIACSNKSTHTHRWTTSHHLTHAKIPQINFNTQRNVTGKHPSQSYPANFAPSSTRVWWDWTSILIFEQLQPTIEPHIAEQQAVVPIECRSIYGPKKYCIVFSISRFVDEFNKPFPLNEYQLSGLWESQNVADQPIIAGVMWSNKSEKYESRSPFGILCGNGGT